MLSKRLLCLVNVTLLYMAVLVVMQPALIRAQEEQVEVAADGTVLQHEAPVPEQVPEPVPDAAEGVVAVEEAAAVVEEAPKEEQVVEEPVEAQPVEEEPAQVQQEEVATQTEESIPADTEAAVTEQEPVATSDEKIEEPATVTSDEKVQPEEPAAPTEPVDTTESKTTSETPSEPKKPVDPNCPDRDHISRCIGHYMDLDKNSKLERKELQTAIDALPWYAKGILNILGSVDKMMKKCDIDGDDAISLEYDWQHNQENCLATCFKRRAVKASFFPQCDL